jgi:predicted transcriptional regulator
MARRDQPRRPTDAELEILGVVWGRGPSTVREVFETLNQAREAGYTTVLKLMQIMTDKGLLTRDEGVRPQVYRATRPQAQTQRQLTRDLLDRAFAGSPGALVLQALSSKRSTPDERRRIRDLLDELEREST